MFWDKYLKKWYLLPLKGFAHARVRWLSKSLRTLCVYRF
jgi:hypothetical protein